MIDETCERAEVWMALEATCRLTDEERAALDRHLSECADCTELRSVVEPEMTSARASVDRRAARRSERSSRKRRGLLIASAVAVLALAASVVVALGVRPLEPIAAEPVWASAGARTVPVTPSATGSSASRQARTSGSAFLTIDQEGKKQDCTNVTAEVLDPESSAPRFIVWGQCPGGQFSAVAYPKKLPGTTPIRALRFADGGTGQEWGASEATLTVTTLEGVGGFSEGEIEATMSARLNRDPVKLKARFRALRTPDRFSP